MISVCFIFLLVASHHAHGEVSCAQLKQNGDLTDGLKTINPEETGDGSGDIQVECDMTSDPDDGITVIHHDSEARIFVHGSGYGGQGSYSRTINYNGITMEQIKQLIQKSASCEQYTKYECQGTVAYFYKDYPFSWWVSRDGINMYMWGGGKTYNRTCACGIDGTCDVTNEVCNCDLNDNTLRTDSGFLTDRDRLPVTVIYAGDLDHTTEYMLHTIGPLRCRGLAPPALRSCAEVQAAGFTKTDSYLLDPDGDGSESAYWAYCDFDQYEDEVVTVVFHDIPYRTHVNGYDDPKYQQVFTYRTSYNELRKLTEESNRCQQFFDIDCYHVQWNLCSWVSIDGNERTSWGGLNLDLHECTCSLDGSCDSSSYSCNCDINDSEWRVERGYIKEELPMKEIHITDTDLSYEQLYYRIGPLECIGSLQTTITRGNSCYKVETEAVTWQQAANACERMDAHLVSLDDNDESVYLTKLTKSVVGPMKTLWSGAQCTPVDSSDSVDCSTTYGYICESTVTEFKDFKKVRTDQSPLESSLLPPIQQAITSGVCSLFCQQTTNCYSFSYNTYTHACKMSSETTDSDAVGEDGFDLFVLQTTYQGCAINVQ